MSETMVISTTVIQSDEKHVIALKAKVDGICGNSACSEILRLVKAQYSLPPAVIFTKFTVVESTLLDAIGVDSDGFLSAVEPNKSVSNLH